MLDYCCVTSSLEFFVVQELTVKKSNDRATERNVVILLGFIVVITKPLVCQGGTSAKQKLRASFSTFFLVRR